MLGLTQDLLWLRFELTATVLQRRQQPNMISPDAEGESLYCFIYPALYLYFYLSSQPFVSILRLIFSS